MATHPSIFAYRVQWTEEPGGLTKNWTWGSQRIGHNWVTNTHNDSSRRVYLPLQMGSQEFALQLVIAWFRAFDVPKVLSSFSGPTDNNGSLCHSLYTRGLGKLQTYLFTKGPLKCSLWILKVKDANSTPEVLYFCTRRFLDRPLIALKRQQGNSSLCPKDLSAFCQ